MHSLFYGINFLGCKFYNSVAFLGNLSDRNFSFANQKEYIINVAHSKDLVLKFYNWRRLIYYHLCRFVAYHLDCFECAILLNLRKKQAILDSKNTTH